MSRQTVSYLQRKFAEAGIEPNARHGQNFLVDLNLVEFIARTADLSGADCVLEVGTGAGSLTTYLAERAGHVVTVEIDDNLYRIASQQLARYPNVTMLQQDALRNKNNLDEGVLTAVRQGMQIVPCTNFKLVANLPYNVGTAILANLLLIDPWPQRMTVTIQKELAERIVAEPRTRDYSALSVWIQSLCDVRIDRILPPSVFWPRPKVQSAIVTILPRPAKKAQFPELDWYHQFVRSLFLHRRKLLRGVLAAACKPELSKLAIDQVLSQLQLPEQVRADQLSVPQIQRLSEAIRQRRNDLSSTSAGDP